MLSIDLIVRLLVPSLFPDAPDAAVSARRNLHRSSDTHLRSLALDQAWPHPAAAAYRRALRSATSLFIDLTGNVSVGDDVGIGHHCVLVTSGHEIGPPRRRLGIARPQAIAIGAGAWIGACVTILPGVTIGPGAIVGAGSIVTRDVPANTVALGSPARVIGTLEQSHE